MLVISGQWQGKNRRCHLHQPRKCAGRGQAKGVGKAKGYFRQIERHPDGGLLGRYLWGLSRSEGIFVLAGSSFLK
jgi:hypothetical protein